MNGNSWELIKKTLIEIRVVEDKYRKIQENPALNGAENALTAHEQEILEKLIEYSGAAAIVADEIARRVLGQ